MSAENVAEKELTEVIEEFTKKKKFRSHFLKGKRSGK